MGATVTSPVKTGTKTWKYSWAGNDPFCVYLDGRLLDDYVIGGTVLDGATTNSLSREFQNDDASEPPAIEVYDSTESATVPQQIAYPPFVTLQWRGDTTAARYRVEQYVGSAWVRKTTIPERGIGYYQYKTDVLADVTTHQFRVTAEDVDGNVWTPRQFDVLMVRNPDPPSISITYAPATHTVTIAAR